MLKLKPALKRLVLPLLSCGLMLGACTAFKGMLGIPDWQPAPASASTAEKVAKDSVPVAAAANTAAHVGEMVPGVSIPASLVDHYTAGYLDSIQQQINRLDAQQKAHDADPSKPAPGSNDWYLAMALSAAAGASNLFSFKHGQKTAGGATT